MTETRHRESNAPPEAKSPDAVDELTVGRPASRPRNRRRPYRFFDIDGHEYRTQDPDAGVRLYNGARRSKKFWFGGLHMSAVSVFIGAPVAINLLPANEQEASGWPELLARTQNALGGNPAAVVMDRAYSIKQVFEINTSAGIASVIPFRKTSAHKTPDDIATDEFDRHGIPHCRHCGGPGDIESAGLGCYKARDKPRLRFRCELRNMPECSSVQSIACSQEWRLLVPLDFDVSVFKFFEPELEHAWIGVFKYLRDRLTRRSRGPRSALLVHVLSG